MTQNTLKAIVRSLTPWALSALAGLVAHFGWHPSLALEIQLFTAAGAGLTIVLHAAEKKFPWVGVFFGWLGAPAYAPSAKNALIADLQAKLDALTPAAPVQTPPVAAPSDTAQVS